MYVKLKFASAGTCDKKKMRIDVSNKPSPTLQKRKTLRIFSRICYYITPTTDRVEHIKNKKDSIRLGLKYPGQT